MRLFALWLCSCFVYSCAVLPPSTVEIDYAFCKAGMQGDYRIAIQHNEDGTDAPVLFVFPVGGPYEIRDIVCAVSGDHVILDMGIGKRL